MVELSDANKTAPTKSYLLLDTRIYAMSRLCQSMINVYINKFLLKNV